MATQASQASKKSTTISIKIMVAVSAGISPPHPVLADLDLEQDRKRVHVRRKTLILQVLCP